jgi:Mob1/phocein family
MRICSPSTQVCLLLNNWIFVRNSKIFPIPAVPFPKNFHSLCKKILTRLFRVFVHVYIHHFDRIVAIGAVIFLNEFLSNLIPSSGWILFNKEFRWHFQKKVKTEINIFVALKKGKMSLFQTGKRPIGILEFLSFFCLQKYLSQSVNPVYFG